MFAIVFLLMAASCTSGRVESPSPTQTAAVSPSGAPPPSLSPTQSATEEDRSLIAALIRFAKAPSEEALGALPFAPEVSLGLGPDLLTTKGRDELIRPSAWKLDAEAFRGYVGPFSALETLATSGETFVSRGPHPHCASPPQAPARDVEALERVSVQPAQESIDTCLKWWSVDLFIDADGRIRAVTLDLFAP
jgi:hypothetical protein